MEVSSCATSAPHLITVVLTSLLGLIFHQNVSDCLLRLTEELYNHEPYLVKECKLQNSRFFMGYEMLQNVAWQHLE